MIGRQGVTAVVLALAVVAGRDAAAQGPAPVREAEAVLATLVEAYGPSGMEAPVREAVQRLLPSGLKTETDSAGNLWVVLGQGAPTIAFVAHLDEIGFAVTAIRDDGTLETRALGGFFPSLFEAQPALVHTGGKVVPGIFLPREANAPRTRTPPPLRVDVGATSRAGVEALGVRVGSAITMPKRYQRLAGTRATGRSFDDRVGSAAQILALRALAGQRLPQTVAFVWSTREEIGLEGAKAAADRLGTALRKVYAIDTFVAADAPFEPTAFAVTPIGKGAVARALDNSSVTPAPLVDSLVALAARQRIPLQVGTTNGGNDGSVFLAYGVADVPLSWPLRYSHSPVEVIDLRDVVSLAQLVAAVARAP